MPLRVSRRTWRGAGVRDDGVMRSLVAVLGAASR